MVSAVAVRDASPRPRRDASRAPRGDASRQYSGRASRVAATDASARALPDASLTAVPDASLTAGGTPRLCAWCRGPIPDAARRDSICCSTRCRQARHRFAVAAGRASVAPGRPLHLAYADPPYPGKAWLYRDHPDYAGEVDHAELIRHLAAYDGWALSTSAAALPRVLASCPPGVRVAAWHRGERPNGASWQPLNAWEPVIYIPGRPVDPSSLQERRVDSLVHGVSPMTTLPTRVIGAKPAAFCRWVFGLIGAAPGDTLDDLFPGSGAVGRAWAVFAGEPSRRTSPYASCPPADATAAADPSGEASSDASGTARATDGSHHG